MPAWVWVWVRAGVEHWHWAGRQQSGAPGPAASRMALEMPLRPMLVMHPLRWHRLRGRESPKWWTDRCYDGALEAALVAFQSLVRVAKGPETS